MAAIDDLFRSVSEAWRPPKRMSLSEWADEYAFLSAESSAKEGRWRTLSYQRGIMDAMTDPTIERLVFMKSARVGYTKMLNNLVGYHIHQDPCSIMVVQPTIEDAEGYSKEEIAPMLRDTKCLRGLVADAKSRDANNTIRNKSFPGGILGMVGANSPGGFRRVSRRVVLFDEIDGYPPSAGAEGDQIKLGIRRTEHFWNRKIIMGSTPTVDGVSRVQKAFEETDKRRYFVPCPHCDSFQFLKWENLKWPNRQPMKAGYVCEECGGFIEHSQKYDMLEHGQWRATAEGLPGVAGFHIWAAYSYSPNASWGQLASEWVEAQGNTEALKTFVNTVKGEVWKDKGQSVSDEILYQRQQEREWDYDGTKLLPEGALLLTNGVDVQPDRLELETIGWGLGQESWSIDYRVIMGDPNGPLVWQLLDNYLATEFQHPTGVRLRAARTFVDTGGSSTKAVYDYVAARADVGVFGIKGRGGDGLPAVGNPSKTDLSKVPIVPLGTFTLKDTVYGSLAIEEPGPGYCHFPKRYDQKFYKGLTAEEVRVKTNKKGFPVREWFKVRERNEQLDCRAYGTAAMLSLNVNFDHLHEAIHGSAQQSEGRRVRGEMAFAS